MEFGIRRITKQLVVTAVARVRSVAAAVVVRLRAGWVGAEMLTLINTFRAGFAVDSAALEREVGKTIARHELYDELDASDKAEARMFELLIENDKDEVLKAIGRIVWDAFARVVKREIDTMNEQIAEQSARDRMEV